MKITVYKGFNSKFLSSVSISPLTPFTNEEKLNPIFLSSKARKIKLLFLDWLEENDDDIFITYEEFTFIQNEIVTEKENSTFIVEFIVNNYYPSLYPLTFPLDDNIFNEISDENLTKNYSKDASAVMKVFEYITRVNDTYYGAYSNFEDLQLGKVIKFFKSSTISDDLSLQEDAVFFITDDATNYIEFLQKIEKSKPNVIGFRPRDTIAGHQIEEALLVYASLNGSKVIKTTKLTVEEAKLNSEIKGVMKEIYGYDEFRDLRFYTDPSSGNETHLVSQGVLISEMIEQAEKSFRNEDFNDIFITSPTGSGKSLIFQLPAIYLGKNYKKLTIVIEPVKALMKDQKDILNKKGYFGVEFLNGDLTPGEKDIVYQRIKDCEVDILYLSPETLLSYSIENIIGDREIGLLIIDEAHIVTTWGQGFRPDYWYLGSYIHKLRYGSTKKGAYTSKVYNFPVCAFTATAIYGIEGTIDEIENSLTMDHGAIEHIGYVKRDNIRFNINVAEKKSISQKEYLSKKGNLLSDELHNIVKFNQKEIVYFPYAKDVNNVIDGGENFNHLIDDISSYVGSYTGSNYFGLTNGLFVDAKNQDFEDFRTGKKKIMLATKAFGMGVDVNDVNCVYHWAPSGNLQDYVQEIGRAARKLEVGKASIDFFENDMNYIKILFGMSAIRDWQMEKVIAGIYAAYKSNGKKPNFLISPESFTYIFAGKGLGDDKAITKLKTCLLMLEKDFISRYPHPVLITRPRPVFTKAFVCLNDDKKDIVLKGKYGSYFKFVAEGRKNVEIITSSGHVEKISDIGDIYELDLKTIWENEYSDMSFPSFKYCFYTPVNEQALKEKDKKVIMKEIEGSISPRIKIEVESKNEATLADIYTQAQNDLIKIVSILKKNFRVNEHFDPEDFSELLKKDGFTKTRALNIANSIFDIVDPTHSWINLSKGKYNFKNGNYSKLFMTILKKGIVNYFKNTNSTSYITYVSPIKNPIKNPKKTDSVPISSVPQQAQDAGLKFLAIMDYITYNIIGGKEPQIFIRLNSPEKLRLICEHKMIPQYKNRYIMEAKRRHENDVAILSYFFQKTDMSDSDRWTYIEDYFLGRDIFTKYLNADKKEEDIEAKHIKPLSKYIDVDKSYQAPLTWDEAKDDFDLDLIDSMKSNKIPMAKYELTTFSDKILQPAQKKAGLELEQAMLSWPDKNVVIFDDSVGNITLSAVKKCGWKIYYLGNINFEKLKEDLQ